MTRSHRAGSPTPEYNPTTGMRVNQEHTSKPLERILRVTPEEHHEEGVNFPYRGVEQHGVPYHDDIPEELEGAPTTEDLELVLPPHYVGRPHKPAPVPVQIVSEFDYERRMWQADQFLIPDGTVNAPLMVVGRQDNRHYVTIRNMDETNPVYIGETPNVSAGTGFQIPANTSSNRLYTTEAVYAVCDSGDTAQISVMWEYSIKV